MKDIKTKLKSTTKSVQSTPKSVSHSPAETVKDIKTVAKDTLVRNAVDKQLETRQSNEPQRAEVEATQQVERAYYSAADTVYQKGKSFAENKLKQHRQQVKIRESQNADIPHTPQNKVVPEVQNPPKQTNNAPKIKENVQAVIYLLYIARQVQTVLLLPQILYSALLQDQSVTNYYCKHSIRVLTVLSYFLFQHGKLFCVKKFG